MFSSFTLTQCELGHNLKFDLQGVEHLELLWKSMGAVLWTYKGYLMLSTVKPQSSSSLTGHPKKPKTVNFDRQA